LARRCLTDQNEERPEPGSVGFGWVEVDAGGKQSASIEVSDCLPLAFSCLSCSVSFSIGFILHLFPSPVDLPDPQLAEHLALLVIGIATLVEQRSNLLSSRKRCKHIPIARGWGGGGRRR
jgi:hypothetical protein